MESFFQKKAYKRITGLNSTASIPWLMLCLLTVLFALFFPQFLSLRNITNVLRNSAIIGTIAVGMTFAMISGVFDLSVGSTMGLSAIIVINLQPQTGTVAAGAVALALLIGVFVGIINGLVVGQYRINSIVTTIGIQYVILGSTLVYSKGQHVWTKNMYEPLEFIGKGKVGIFPFPIVIFLIVTLISQLILSRTRFGCQLYATGGNPEAAELSGVNIGKIRILAYMFSGITASIAGIIIAARAQNLDPSFGIGQETDVLSCVLLGGVSLYGGKGSVIGTLAGVLILYVVSNAMTLSGASYETQLICKGLIFFLTVAVSVIWQKNEK